jgi:hypothetical protein
MKTGFIFFLLFPVALFLALFTEAKGPAHEKEAEGIWRYESVQWLDTTVQKVTSAQTLFYYHDSTIDVTFNCRRQVGCEFPDGYIRLKAKWNDKELLMFTPQKEWKKVGTWNGLQFVLEEKNYIARFARVKRQELDSVYSNEINIIHDRKIFHY